MTGAGTEAPCTCSFARPCCLHEPRAGVGDIGVLPNSIEKSEWLAERERAAAEKAWDESFERTHDCPYYIEANCEKYCRPTNPYRTGKEATE